MSRGDPHWPENYVAAEDPILPYARLSLWLLQPQPSYYKDKQEILGKRAPRETGELQRGMDGGRSGIEVQRHGGESNKHTLGQPSSVI